MSTKRDYTGRLTNPLPNVDPAGGAVASDVYTEVHAYGPVAQAGGGAPPLFNHSHRWTVDPAADAIHRQVRAVWDGDLYIVKVINPDEPDPAKKLVWLALELLLLSPTPLPLEEATEQLPRPPGLALYGNVRHAGLRDAMTALGYGAGDEADLLTQFLNLGTAGDDVATVLPVRAGDLIGEIGEITLAGGGTATALDFELAVARGGRDPVYPDAFYLQAETAVGPALFLGEPDTPSYERDPNLSVWAVSEKRVILWCNDEWNQPLGQNRVADVTLTRDDGASLQLSFPQLTPGQEPIGGFALADWAEGHVTASVEARPLGQQAGEPLLLSEVPGNAAAAAVAGITLERPAEITIQTLDPLDWFPAQGGKGWDPGTPDRPAAHTTVTLAAPHAPARFTNGNRVTPLIDGTAYFLDFARELDRITGGGHYLCMAKWWVDHDFPLTQVYDPSQYPAAKVGDDARTMLEHWQRISGLGAPIFGLMWDPTGGPLTELPEVLLEGPVKRLWTSMEDHDELARAFAAALMATDELDGIYNPNKDAVTALNGVGSGTTEAILDGRHRPGASHHAKMAVVRNADGLVAWLGGIDINTNRVNTPAHHDYEPGAMPYHDVHCRIEGPAARDVLRTFISRWNDHPALGFDPDDQWTPDPGPLNGKTGDVECGALGFHDGSHHLLLDDTDDRDGGTELVQIGRTFGNCRGLEGAQILNGGDFFNDNGYAFAPDGDFTIESAILGAIKRARRFIYIEDQFLANMKIATAVADKIDDRRKALEADPEGEEPFYVYILVPYFPNSTKTATDLGRWTRPADAVKRFAQWAAEIPDPSPSLAGKVIELAKKGQPVPDRFEKVDSYGYTHTRWYDLLSSVDNAKKYWQMHCLRLPPYQTRQLRYYGDTVTYELVAVPMDERRVYIHTKVVIVDDIWATIGSANMCVRSYTMDSEINCSFVDGRTDARGLRVSVRDLRRALWADHWGVEIDQVPEAPGNDPTVIAAWKSRVAQAAASLPASVGGTRPFGSRVYEWPLNEVGLGLNTYPKFTWSREGAEVRIEPYGVTELPLYWWFVDQYGKAPWARKAADLMPPEIGSERFRFDGEDGATGPGFDLVPHPDE